MRRMKRTIIISLGLLLLVSGAMATETRVMTMGENNNILLDEANIWLYPSRINYYPDLAEMELADPREVDEDDVSAIERVGLNLKFGGDNPYVIGLYLHNQAEYYNQFSPISGRSHGSYDNEGYFGSSNKRADLFYGRKLGEANFGMRFGYVHSSWKNLSATGLGSHDERSFSQMTIDLGVTLRDGLFDIMVGLESFTFTDMVTVSLNQDSTGGPNGGMVNFEPDGNKRFYFRTRYFHELNPNITVVPHLGFSTGTYKFNNWGWNSNDTLAQGGINLLEQSSKATSKEFTLGSGLHYTPSSKVLAVIDFGLTTLKNGYTLKTIISDTVSTTSENSFKWTALPYLKLGFEADVFKWLDVRFGAETYWTKYTYEDVDDARKWVERYPDNRNYLGFGFHWGQFHVDTYANPELFINGFDFISGDDTDWMNFRISAIYEMH